MNTKEFNRLIKLANELDNSGFVEEANAIDALINNASDEAIYVFEDKNSPDLFYKGTIDHMVGLIVEGGRPAIVNEEGLTNQFGQEAEVVDAPDFWKEINAENAVENNVYDNLVGQIEGIADFKQPKIKTREEQEREGALRVIGHLFTYLNFAKVRLDAIKAIHGRIVTNISDMVEKARTTLGEFKSVVGISNADLKSFMKEIRFERADVRFRRVGRDPMILQDLERAKEEAMKLEKMYSSAVLMPKYFAQIIDILNAAIDRAVF